MSILSIYMNHLLQAQFSQLPPSLAQFSPTDPDIVVYTGYGMQKVVQFYSLSQKKVLWIKGNVIHHFYYDSISLFLLLSTLMHSFFPSMPLILRSKLFKHY